jgi:hypothetical protein
MINHFRTLLLNLPTTGTPPPADYQALHLAPGFPGVGMPADLRRVHELLFTMPSSSVLAPDLSVQPEEFRPAMTANYQVLLLGCGMEQMMLDLDPRTTFRPLAGSPVFRPLRASTSQDVISGGGSEGLVLMDNLQGRSAWPDGSPFQEYALQLFDGQMWVQDMASQQPVSDTVVPVLDAQGRSQRITVSHPRFDPGLSFDVRLQHPGPVLDAVLVFRLSAPSTAVLDEALAAVLQREAEVNEALRRRPGTPDPASYDRQWRDHFSGAYRLAGLAAGVVCRMNHLWLQGIAL